MKSKRMIGWILLGLVLSLGLLLRLTSSAQAQARVVPTSSFSTNTKLAGPVSFGSPDQPYGVRRPVTGADRTAIKLYRSKKPIFSTTFSQPADFQANWTFIESNFASLKSCQKRGNAEPSNVGLRFKTLIATNCKARWSTGSIVSKAQYTYGFFEVTMKIADIRGMNNAFWLTSKDHYEMDVGEVQYPNYSHLGLQCWPVDKGEKHTGVGFGAKFTNNLSYNFHDYGLLWTPKELIFEVDGEPVAVLMTNNAIKGPANLLLSNALADWASGPVPEHPEGHAMVVKSLRVISLDPRMP